MLRRLSLDERSPQSWDWRVRATPLSLLLILARRDRPWAGSREGRPCALKSKMHGVGIKRISTDLGEGAPDAGDPLIGSVAGSLDGRGPIAAFAAVASL